MIVKTLVMHAGSLKYSPDLWRDASYAVDDPANGFAHVPAALRDRIKTLLDGEMPNYNGEVLEIPNGIEIN
jgi:hypothetical protein